MDERGSLGSEGPPARGEDDRALDLSYKALNRRDRTVAEVRTLLERKRVEPASIEAAVAQLEAEGFLNDARYALRFAEDKRSIERWGGERIARDLQRRGVPADLIEAAIATQDRDGELASALELLAQRVTVPPEDDRARDRAWRLLVRRGYDPELAYDAIRTHVARLTGTPRAA